MILYFLGCNDPPNSKTGGSLSGQVCSKSWNSTWCRHQGQTGEIQGTVLSLKQKKASLTFVESGSPFAKN